MNLSETPDPGQESEFLAHLGHELRNPLTTILTIADALRDGIYGSLTAGQDAPVASLRQSVRHALDAVSHVLEAAECSSSSSSSPGEAQPSPVQDRTEIPGAAASGGVMKNDGSAAPLILVADDEEFLLAVVQDCLESAGYRVCTASNGREAVEVTQALRPALIIMDSQMPELNGLEAIRLIRQDPDPKTANVPILSLSGLSRQADRDQCLAAGATACLGKPFGVSEITCAVMELIGPAPAAVTPLAE